jgi:hypothetical protein
MNSENELLQRLVLSKKIMEKHDQMERGKTPTQSINTPMLEDYQPINAKYNLPQDLLQEDFQQSKPIPNPELPTADRIAKSKLPDEIKKLMLEHPIDKPNMGIGSPTLSNELIDKASRLMGVDASGKQVQQQPKRKDVMTESLSSSNEKLKDMLREVVEEVLHENGLLIESETNSNDVFKFRVGDHIFEGKVTKIKKVSK